MRFSISTTVTHRDSEVSLGEVFDLSDRSENTTPNHTAFDHPALKVLSFRSTVLYFGRCVTSKSHLSATISQYSLHLVQIKTKVHFILVTLWAKFGDILNYWTNSSCKIFVDDTEIKFHHNLTSAIKYQQQNHLEKLPKNGPLSCYVPFFLNKCLMSDSVLFWAYLDVRII